MMSDVVLDSDRIHDEHLQRLNFLVEFVLNFGTKFSLSLLFGFAPKDSLFIQWISELIDDPASLFLAEFVKSKNLHISLTALIYDITKLIRNYRTNLSTCTPNPVSLYKYFIRSLPACDSVIQRLFLSPKLGPFIFKDLILIGFLDFDVDLDCFTLSSNMGRFLVIFDHSTLASVDELLGHFYHVKKYVLHTNEEYKPSSPAILLTSWHHLHCVIRRKHKALRDSFTILSGQAYENFNSGFVQPLSTLLSSPDTFGSRRISTLLKFHSVQLFDPANVIILNVFPFESNPHLKVLVRLSLRSSFKFSVKEFLRLVLLFDVDRSWQPQQLEHKSSNLFLVLKDWSLLWSCDSTYSVTLCPNAETSLFQFSIGQLPHWLPFSSLSDQEVMDPSASSPARLPPILALEACHSKTYTPFSLFRLCSVEILKIMENSFSFSPFRCKLLVQDFTCDAYLMVTEKDLFIKLLAMQNIPDPCGFYQELLKSFESEKNQVVETVNLLFSSLFKLTLVVRFADFWPSRTLHQDKDETIGSIKSLMKSMDQTYKKTIILDGKPIVTIAIHKPTFVLVDVYKSSVMDCRNDACQILSTL